MKKSKKTQLQYRFAKILHKILCKSRPYIEVLLLIIIIVTVLHTRFEASIVEANANMRLQEAKCTLKEAEITVKNVKEFKIAEEVEQFEELDIRITFYCPCEECSEQWGTLTAIGTRCKPNYTIAVDPKFIPLGSICYIPGFGLRVAEDVGGAVKGNTVDMYVETHHETLQGGVQYGKLLILKKGVIRR